MNIYHFEKIGSIVDKKYSVICSAVSFIPFEIHQSTVSTKDDEI